MALGDNILKQISAGVIVWDHDGTPFTFPATMGGITVTCEIPELKEVKRDGYGAAAIDLITAGTKNPKIEFNMSDLDATTLDEINGVTTSTNAAIVYDDCGVSLRGLAKKVYIKPVINGVTSTTESEWVEGYKVTPPVMDFALEWKDDSDQRVVKCTMFMLPSDATGLERAYGSLGVNT